MSFVGKEGPSQEGKKLVQSHNVQFSPAKEQACCVCVEGRRRLNKPFVSAKLTYLVQTDSDTPVCRWRL